MFEPDKFYRGIPGPDRVDDTAVPRRGWVGTRRERRRFPGDDQGVVYTEYLVILTLVSLGVMGALIALGVPLLNLFLYQQAVVLLPFP